METKHVPANIVRNEIRVENSRFIATLGPAFSVEEEKLFISKIKNEFRDASHNVPVFIIGHGASKICHTSDDGEPSGTAGRPALAVLQGSGLGDVVIVVTRYFGGKKLGKGGLVRAYGDAVREILDITPLAQKSSTHTVKLSIPYSLYERVKILINIHNGEVVDESFLVDVTITSRFLVDTYPSFDLALRELSHGEISSKIINTDNETIFPIQQ